MYELLVKEADRNHLILKD